MFVWTQQLQQKPKNLKKHGLQKPNKTANYVFAGALIFCSNGREARRIQVAPSDASEKSGWKVTYSKKKQTELLGSFRTEAACLTVSHELEEKLKAGGFVCQEKKLHITVHE